MAHEELKAELERLKAANKSLEDQLLFARQKASLYYIAASELDALKNQKDSFVEQVSVGTCTDDMVVSCESSVSVATQTMSVSSAELETETYLDLAQTEIATLKSFIDESKRADPHRARMGTVLGSDFSFLVDEYRDLFNQILKQNKMSINHSIEIKRRDEIISSLFDKIRMIEEAFNRKLQDTNKIASARQEVIQALGDQVKDAIRQPSYHDSLEIGAMQSEMEDLKAELSMARTNWAATRDELVRLQFRVGVDGNGSSQSDRHQSAFPPPIVELLDSETRESGTISGIRSIRPRIHN